MLASGAAVVLFFLFLSRRKKRKSVSPEKDFENRYGALMCEGRRCSHNDECSEPERLFCQEVLHKVFQPGAFSAQHIVVLPSGARKIDFAAITSDGTRIAIELDGYTAHATNLDRKQFDLQLKRQNELVLQGWRVLRFSFDQCVYGANYCAESIKALLGETGETRPLPAVYKDVFYPDAEKETAKDTLHMAGALWSGRRKRWYFPEPMAPELPSHWKLTRWTVCPTCGKKSHELSGKFGVFWKCKECSRTFN